MEKKNNWFPVNNCVESKNAIQLVIISKSLSDVFNEGCDKFVIDARDMNGKKLFSILEKIQTLSLLTFKGEHKTMVYIKLDLWALWGVEYKTKCLTKDKIEELRKKCWPNIDILFSRIKFSETTIICV